MNTTDNEIVNEINKLDKHLSGVSKPFSAINKWIAGIGNIGKYMEKHPKLKGLFILH